MWTTGAGPEIFHWTDMGDPRGDVEEQPCDPEALAQRFLGLDERETMSRCDKEACTSGG